MKCRAFYRLAGLSLLSFVISVELAGQAPANPPHYTITDLGTLGGTYSYGYGINALGVVSGGAATATQTDGLSQTAFLFYAGHMLNLGTLDPSCADCSSEAGGPNIYLESPVISETGQPAYMNEDFCEFGTHRQCLGALWWLGSYQVLKPFPGGYNSSAYWTNDRGESAGFAETGQPDPSCMMPFQVLRYEAVKWDRNGKHHLLRPLPGDTVGFAFGINRAGQAVGASGLCSNVLLPPAPSAPHAVLWQPDGTPVNLGSLNNAVSNVADDINNRGTVVGGSSFADGSFVSFRWTRQTGIQPLPTLPDAVITIATCCNTINDRDEVVGVSIDTSQNVTAFVIRDDKITDLNTLIPIDSGWYLLWATSINNQGEITGWGVIGNEVHAFLAIPHDAPDSDSTFHASRTTKQPPVLSDPVKHFIAQRLGGFWHVK